MQFGQAIIPRWSLSRCALISGTTSGTAGSIRNALDLSITIAPALTAIGANSRDCWAPAENSAKSTPLNEPAVSFSIRSFCSPNLTVLPTERSEAMTRNSRTAKFRS